MIKKNLKNILTGIAFSSLFFSFDAHSMLTSAAVADSVLGGTQHEQLAQVRAMPRVDIDRRKEVITGYLTDTAQPLVSGSKIGAGGATEGQKITFAGAVKELITLPLLARIGVLTNGLAIRDQDVVVAHGAAGTTRLLNEIRGICAAPDSLTDNAGAEIGGRETLDQAYPAFVARMTAADTGNADNAINGPVVDLSAGILDGVAGGADRVATLCDHILSPATNLVGYAALGGATDFATIGALGVVVGPTVNGVAMTAEIVAGFTSDFNLRWMLARLLLEEVEASGAGMSFRAVRALGKLMSGF